MEEQQKRSSIADIINDFRFDEFASQLVDWTRNFINSQHRLVVYAIYTAGVALIVLASIACWYWYDKNYEEKGWQMYANIQQQLSNIPNPQAEQVTQALQVLVSQYPRSRAAGVANYRIGGICYFQGNFDGAIIAYGDFVKRSNKNNELATMAYIALGYGYEMKGEYEKALENYLNGMKTQNGNNFASTNFQNIARMYEIKNYSVNALDYYKKALEKAQDKLMKRIMQNKIASLQK